MSGHKHNPLYTPGSGIRRMCCSKYYQFHSMTAANSRKGKHKLAVGSAIGTNGGGSVLARTKVPQ